MPEAGILRIKEKTHVRFVLASDAELDQGLLFLFAVFVVFACHQVDSVQLAEDGVGVGIDLHLVALRLALRIDVGAGDDGEALGALAKLIAQEALGIQRNRDEGARARAARDGGDHVDLIGGTRARLGHVLHGAVEGSARLGLVHQVEEGKEGLFAPLGGAAGHLLCHHGIVVRGEPFPQVFPSQAVADRAHAGGVGHGNIGGGGDVGNAPGIGVKHQCRDLVVRQVAKLVDLLIQNIHGGGACAAHADQ